MDEDLDNGDVSGQGFEGNDGDEYQEVTVVSWLDRLLSSIVGVFFGIFLFLASFGVLFINEASTDFSHLAKSAVVLTETTANPSAQGKTVALTGTIKAPKPVGDNLYLKPGAYVALARTVEMYAWKEEKSTRTQTNVGGSQTQVTTYRYTKHWTDSPESSGSFNKPNYRNPPQAIKNQLFKADVATIGRYSVDMANLTDVVNYSSSCLGDSRRYSQYNSGGITLPEGNPLSLTPQMLLQTKAQPVGNYLFQGEGTPQAPKIGDLRICYTALPTDSTVTLFGKLQGDRVVPADGSGESFFRLFAGNREPAIATLKTEYRMWLWFFRVLGFGMMWVGLWLLINPISVVLSFIPFLGDIADTFNGITSFVAAFVLSAVTILVLSLVHNPGVLAGSVAVTLVVLLLGRKVLRSAHA